MSARACYIKVNTCWVHASSNTHLNFVSLYAVDLRRRRLVSFFFYFKEQTEIVYVRRPTTGQRVFTLSCRVTQEKQNDAAVRVRREEENTLSDTTHLENASQIRRVTSHFTLDMLHAHVNGRHAVKWKVNCSVVLTDYKHLPRSDGTAPLQYQRTRSTHGFGYATRSRAMLI